MYLISDFKLIYLYITTENKAEKREAIKGMVILGVIWCLHFTGYNGLASLQGSLNRQDGMGVLTQGLTYAFIVVSSFYLPRYSYQILQNVIAEQKA